MGIVAPAPEMGDESPKDERLNIKLNKTAKRVLNTKHDFDELYGKKLSWDEFIDYLWTYIDLPADKGAAAKAIKMLGETSTHLRDNREEEAAEIVEIFSCALRDVMHGKIQPRQLRDALIDLDG